MGFNSRYKGLNTFVFTADVGSVRQCKISAKYGCSVTVALEWNAQGKRGRVRPRNTWRRTVFEEGKGVTKTWEEIKTDTKNRVRWRILVEALCFEPE